MVAADGASHWLEELEIHDGRFLGKITPHAIPVPMLERRAAGWLMNQQPGPFIVTAELPPDLFGWADGLRRAHFPPERNFLSAHVTLFHAFAPSLREDLRPVLTRAAGEHAPMRARVTGLMNLGRGTAIAVESPAMSALRKGIADHFHGALTAQDQHPPRLHITIQNKVALEAARALQQELSSQIEPREFRFTGIGLHIYRGGPWEADGIWPFRGTG